MFRLDADILSIKQGLPAELHAIWCLPPSLEELEDDPANVFRYQLVLNLLRGSVMSAEESFLMRPGYIYLTC